MEIFWTSVILLSLCLLQGTLSEMQSMCKGNLPLVMTVTVNSNVTVPCPVLIAPDMDFTLHKGHEEVISIYVKINHTSLSKERKASNIDFPAEFSVNSDNSTSFTLVGVTMNNTALYTCEAKINYPPPFKKVEHTPQTIVFVEDRHVKEIRCQHGNRMDLWLVLGFLIMYGVVLTCIVFILRRKNGFPSKDREFKRKWQGVQHPTRQGYNIVTRNRLTTSTLTTPVKDNLQNNKSDSCALKAPMASNYV